LVGYVVELVYLFAERIYCGGQLPPRVIAHMDRASLMVCYRDRISRSLGSNTRSGV
jgi:hypothetical protein